MPLSLPSSPFSSHAYLCPFYVYVLSDSLVKSSLLLFPSHTYFSPLHAFFYIFQYSFSSLFLSLPSPFLSYFTLKPLLRPLLIYFLSPSLLPLPFAYIFHLSFLFPLLSPLFSPLFSRSCLSPLYVYYFSSYLFSVSLFFF